MIFKNKVWKYQLFKEVSMDLRGRLLDYYAELCSDSEITELEMEDEMDKIALMSPEEIRETYDRMFGA
jgi:hypothetical protein